MIRVVRSGLTLVACDAIVNPANSSGTMGGGVALAIKRAGGDAIEKEAVGKAPIPVGAAVHTNAGRLKCRYVIHAPTMARPAERTDADKIRKAVRASLLLAKGMSLESVAFPGMGTGVGGVGFRVAAKAMVDEASRFHFKDVILVAKESELEKAFRAAVRDKNLR